MNKLSALALGTALTLSMPFAALAQDADAGVDTGVDVGVEAGEDTGADVGVDAGVDAGADTDAMSIEMEAGGDAMAGAGTEMSEYSFGDLDSALQGAASADLSSVTADTEIEVVTVSSLSDDGEFTADAFADAHSTYEADIATLQGNVEGNSDVVAALEAEGYASEDVVGVWSQADGSLTVFVDDTSEADMDAGGAATETEMNETDASADTGMDADASTDAGAEAGAEMEAEGETSTQ